MQINLCRYLILSWTLDGYLSGHYFTSKSEKNLKRFPKKEEFKFTDLETKVYTFIIKDKRKKYIRLYESFKIMREKNSRASVDSKTIDYERIFCTRCKKPIHHISSGMRNRLSKRILICCGPDKNFESFSNESNGLAKSLNKLIANIKRINKNSPSRKRK